MGAVPEELQMLFLQEHYSLDIPKLASGIIEYENKVSFARFPPLFFSTIFIYVSLSFHLSRSVYQKNMFNHGQWSYAKSSI